MSDSRSWELSIERIRQFDSVARAYDRHRPPFPSGAFDRLVEDAGLAPGSRVVELGAGTGRATLELVKRGLEVTALEPGETLRTIGAAKLATLTSAVTWIAERFETWQPRDLTSDVVFAADAWHWIEPAPGARRAAEALRPGGHLAILWSVTEGFRPDAFADELREAWVAGGAGEEPVRWLNDMDDDGSSWIEPVVATGMFEPARRSWHRFERRMRAEELVAELGSYGWVIALSLEAREAVLHETLALVAGRFGGSIIRRDAAVLYLLRRADSVIG